VTPWIKRILAPVLGLAACMTAAQALAAQGSAAAEPPPLALVGGALIDGRGGAPVPDSVVLIRGRRIEAVGTTATLPPPAGYKVISTEGMTVMPGLWDMHTHLQYSAHTDLGYWNAKYQPRMEREIMPAIAGQLLMAGVTSARDAMAPLDPILRVKDRIARGEIPGPTLYVAGALLEHRPPAGAEAFRWPVSGVADAKAKVDLLADKGVDFIKMLCVPDMPQEDANAIVAEAHVRGLKVLAHGREDAEIRKCLAADVDEFEHLGTRALLPEDIVAGIRARTRPLYWTPTIGSPVNYRYLLTNREMLDGPEWRQGLPADVVADVQASLKNLPAAIRGSPNTYASDLDLYRTKFEQVRGAGAKMLVGADAGGPGHFHPYGLWLELDAWVNHMGVDPMEAIRTATAFAAETMGVGKDYGTVEAGKYADVIVVDGDPLRHIEVLRRPVVVIKSGRQVK